jgi:hypothetical protein
MVDLHKHDKKNEKTGVSPFSGSFIEATPGCLGLKEGILPSLPFPLERLNPLPALVFAGIDGRHQILGG